MGGGNSLFPILELPQLALTDTAVRSARPSKKTIKLYDAGGLFLQSSPSGGKWWHFKYRYLDKEKLLSLGTYPDISLKAAREKRDDARKLLANGSDPSAVKQSQKLEKRMTAANTLEAIGREWYAKQLDKWAPTTAKKVKGMLEKNIYPYLGNTPITHVTAKALLQTIQRIEKDGNIETAHRVLQNCGQIFRYAIATERAQADLSLVLKGALTPVNAKHHASITDPKLVGDLIRTIHGYEGAFITQCALKLAPLVFVRPGELRNAEWQEIDLDAGEWRIPANKMKMKAVHIVPLSTQAVKILRELHQHTGSGRYVFPGLCATDTPMSENTVNAALRRLGYEKEQMTGHGFRSMASTILHEQGWPHEVIERQLAHAERNAVSAAYNYAEHLPKRREMMQHWADYLDGLRAGAKVVNIKKA